MRAMVQVDTYVYTLILTSFSNSLSALKAVSINLCVGEEEEVSVACEHDAGSGARLKKQKSLYLEGIETVSLYLHPSLLQVDHYGNVPHLVFPWGAYYRAAT